MQRISDGVRDYKLLGRCGAYYEAEGTRRQMAKYKPPDGS
jgi:hypothetical protein